MSHRPTSSSSNDGRQGTILDTLGLNKLNLDTLHHDVRRNLTRVDPRLSDDLKNITLLLKEEKNVLSSLQNVANERRAVSKHVFIWGKEDNGDDIADITEKFANLLSKIADAETVLCEKYDHYRNTLKEIRDADQRLHVPKERRKKVNDEIARIMKSHPTSPRIQELQNDLQRINTDSTADEFEVGNIKRQKLRDALGLQLNAIFEAAEKIAIISGFGWYLLEQIDVTPARIGEPRAKYEGHKVTQEVVKECQIALHRWQPPADIKVILPALTNTEPGQLATQKLEYEAKIHQLQASLKSQRETSDTQIAEIYENLAEQKKTYEEQILELNTTVVAQREGYEAQIIDLSDALSAQKHGYEVQLNDLASALAAHKERSRSEIEELTAALSTSQQHSEVQIKKLSSSLTAENQKYETQLKDYNALLTQKRDYEIQLREKDTLISKLQNEMNSVATEKGKLSQLVKNLEETLQSKTSTVDQKEEKIVRLEDDISSIKSQLAGLKLTPSAEVSPTTSRASTGPLPSLNPAAVDVPTSSAVEQEGLNRAASIAHPQIGSPYQQPIYGQQSQGYYNHPQFYQPQYYQPQQPPPQGFYGPVGQPGQPEYNYQPLGQVSQPPPPPPNEPGGFVGGFFLGPPDEAPPAYDGPPKEGFPGEKKEKN
ncbi:hypothetical protein G9A89_018563 [Geosiphon pyriformis]|nr:hypothetical protein G9A89_018563 [Geosiphon pyriformis]